MKVWFLLFIFLLGLGLGLGASSVAPKYLGPYFPKSLTPARSGVQGTVVKKQSEEDRLLLTISAPDGALLATFLKKITEISLLVDEGDAVTLDVRVYAPFVTDPPILRVKKPDGFSPRLGDHTLEESQTETPPLSPNPEAVPDDSGLPSPKSEEPSAVPEKDLESEQLL